MPPEIQLRPLVPSDVPALAGLHVQTFMETHGRGPSVEIREQQWSQKIQDPNHLCFLATSEDGTLVAFINGYPTPEDPLFDGHLEKIYVLRAWHRRGIGRMLFACLVGALRDQGVRSINLFSQAENPSIGFFDKMGGDRLFSSEGEFHGGYCWPDIGQLI